MATDIVTVAHVSGFIAVAIVISQFLVPTLLAIVLAARLGTENNAVTWSVAARSIQESYWPTIFRSETSAWAGVRLDVLAATWIRKLGLFLIAVAGIVTPLGLYNDIVASGSVNTAFQYARDPGPFGYATPARSNLGFMRRCDSDGTEGTLCPGNNEPESNPGKETVQLPWGYDGRISAHRYDYLQSGLSKDSNTISSLWDIEWRQYAITADPVNSSSPFPTNNGSKYIIGYYQNFQTVVLSEGYDVVEGLVVDTDNGGIGFRNHTIPEDNTLSASWSEDITFIEPEAVCVPNNLTISFEIGPAEAGMLPQLSNYKLVDNGGFVNLDKSFKPHIDSDAQSDLNLYNRAYIAAWLNNGLLAAYFDASDRNLSYMHSTLGQEFSISSIEGLKVFWGAFRTTQTFSDFLPLEEADATGPHKITAADFETINAQCQPLGPTSPGNINTIPVGCSMAYAVAQPAGASGSVGNQAAVPEPDSKWTMDLYSCAITVKAGVKTVEFKQNSTSFTGLSVTSANDKTYRSQDVPWWGVEHTTVTLENARPLWGLVDPSLPLPENMTTYQSEWLYLPGYIDSTTASSSSWFAENMPGSDFYAPALVGSITIGASLTADGGDTGVGPGFGQFQTLDYSGALSAPLLHKWQSLSGSASGIATILSQVWTDIATNAVVGTKGMMGARPPRQLSPINTKRSTTDDTLTAPFQVISTYSSEVRYHWPFAIPALLVAALLVAIILSTALLLLITRRPMTSARAAVKHTALGRVMASMVYAGECDPDAHRDSWISAIGRRAIFYNGRGPPTAVRSGSASGSTGDNVTMHQVNTKNANSATAYMPVQQQEVE